MKMKKVKILRYFLCLILIFVVFFVAGKGLLWYLRFKESKKNVTFMPVPLTEKDMMWRQYNNEDFGFKMKFPYGIYTLNTEKADRDMKVTNSGTVNNPLEKIVVSSKEDNKMQAVFEIFDKYDKEISPNEYKEGYLYTFGGCDLRWGFKPDNIKFLENTKLKVLRVVGGSQEKDKFWACYFFKGQSDNLIVVDTQNYEQSSWLYTAVDYGVIKTMVESITY